MNVGGAQIQVAVLMLMLMLMLMVVVMVVVPMMMVMVIFQQPGAGQIDQQPQYSHPNGLIVLNGGRGQQTLNRLHQHQAGNGEQEEGAGVTTQYFDFPGAEGKTRVNGIAAGSGIGGQCQHQSKRVRAHMPA